MVRIAVCAGFLALVTLPVAADEVKPPSSIESVTVYAQGANVVRRVPIVLPLGASTIVLDDLPVEIETQSLKVDGSADQAIEIGSVETKIEPADPDKDPKRNAVLAEIQALEDRLAAIGDKVGALEGRQKFIEALIEKPPAGFGKALGEGGDGMEKWTTASEAIGNDLAAVAEAIRGLHIQERDTQKEIDKRRKALADLPPPRDHMVVKIEISAAAPATGSLAISYRTPSAGWWPAYDAMLATGEADGKPKLTIVRRADVRQATGEDWTDVALVLSTARPAVGTAAPILNSSIVSVVTEDYGALRKRDESAGIAAAPKSEGDLLGEGRVDKPVRVAEAVADFGDFRAEYRVPGKVSVASGDSARSVRVASEVAEAELEIRAVPTLSASAYLHAGFVAQSGAPLLAGRVALFRDGAFVGNGTIEFTEAGARLDLGFGADDRVKVTRAVFAKETGKSGILTSRKTDTRDFKISVENHHAQPIKITVLDRVPFSENEDIVVERLDGSTEPTAENVEDRRGVLAWTYTYAPSESRDIRNGYRVSWPASESVVVLD